MNVLFIHQNFVGYNHPGGTRHLEFASHLVDHGHEVTIVASSLDYLTGQRIVKQNSWYTKHEIQGVRVLRSYAYPSLHRSFAWRAFSFLSFMVTAAWTGWRAGPVDVIIGTSPPIFQLLSAWFVALIRRKPLVVEVRDLWPEFAIDMGVLKNPILILLARCFERFFYSRATHLVVNSPAYRDYLLAKGIPSQKISCIPNGVDPKMFQPESDGASIRKELGLNSQYVVTYAGALGQANDIETILRAADRLREEPKLHFLLVGDGKERKNLESRAKSLGLNNVTFAGSYPKNRMWEVLAASDVCVALLRDIPMFRTTYPNKVFDYMAAGRPTVLAIDGVIRQVMESAEGGRYVPPGDDAALAASICELRNDMAGSRRMGMAARRYVEQHFHREKHAKQLEDLLASIVDRRHTSEAAS